MDPHPKTNKADFIRIKKLHTGKTPVKSMKDKPQAGGYSLQIMYLREDSYPECLKNSQVPAATTQVTQLGIGQRHTQQILVAKRHEMMLNTGSLQGFANSKA